jgi:uncharacterized protein (DUF433 family)
MTDTQAERVDWRRYIVSTPGVLGGKPRITGTRPSVAFILGCLAAGSTPDEILSEYHGLKREEIAACLDFARDLVERRGV